MPDVIMIKAKQVKKAFSIEKSKEINLPANLNKHAIRINGAAKWR